MKYITAIFIFFLINSAFSQNQKNNFLFNSFITGTSLTIRDAGNFQKINELTWNFNACTSVGKHYYFGIQALNIFLEYKIAQTSYYKFLLITSSPAENGAFKTSSA